ncbi:MAG: N-acyl-L-amino acid amidohydrolase [Niastella sp. SCN 39-18]|nr:amidohydrolase [Sphingobacteriales bacterium]ODT51569.1 MAG: N-acyl-L-amino acid amidohydrolase [Niastella sp. SCN 39-18]OJW08240.1 MAG: N-acyl-L-amino acid amidohydrolase [Sphingobacteriales bacterium 39-19]
MLQIIKELAKNYKEEFIGIRRHLHANPELSYKEFETSAFVQNKLKEYGIAPRVIATTGVTAIIEGKNPGKRIIALRADMDALPIEENSVQPYVSKNKGVMHACGHDVHSTCLLGASKILMETRSQWEGTVKLVFQPGEEKNPGGASYMIRDGVLENPTPQKMIALHVNPALEVGEFSFREGMAMASADEIYITIKAKGGHAAAPQYTADPILIASHIIISLQQIISRNNVPTNPSVLSITAIHGGNTTNVIPAEVKLMGTFRAMDETWRFDAHQRIKKMTEQIALSMGAVAEVNIDVGYPFVFNDPELTRQAYKLAEQFAGKENVSETELRMGAEDFAYYSQKVPATFFRLGTGNKKKGITAIVHTPVFDIDEDAIEQGMGMMAWLAASL